MVTTGLRPGYLRKNGVPYSANAVVTGDVGAFEIVAGVPARRLRRRFAAEVVARIEKQAAS